jgi:rhamnose transport system substrate-binding protein
MTASSPYRRLLASLLVAALALVAAACGSTKDSSSSSSSSSGSSSQSSSGADAGVNPSAAIPKGLKMVSIPKQLGNPYEEFEHSGVVEALKELGGSDRIQGSTDAGASSQVPLINSIVQQKPAAIIIAGNDPNAVAPALKQASQRGVKVVAMDSDVAPDARSVFVNQVTTKLVGQNQVESIAKQIGNKGQIAVLSATANATNQNAWIKVMKDTLKQPKYKDIKLVKVAYGDDDDQKSFQQTQGLLSAYPNLKGIISPTTVGVAAAARYLSTSPKKGKVKLTGLGFPNQMRKFVQNGTVDEFQLWVPKDVGYLAGQAAAALVAGRITGKPGETFTAGRLGKYKIGPNGEIVLGPLTTFNKENISKFNF